MKQTNLKKLQRNYMLSITRYTLYVYKCVVLLCRIYLLICDHLHVQNSKVTKWYKVKTLPPTSFHGPPSSSWRKCILFISSIALQRCSLRNYIHIYILPLSCFFKDGSILCFVSHLAHFSI